LSKSIFYHGMVMMNGSRETRWDTEKLVTFENGASMVLMKTQSVPQRWKLLWTEPDGTFGQSEGHSELLLRVTYNEICTQLSQPEINKLRNELLDTEGNLKVPLRRELMDRWFRLEMQDDQLVDGLEAKEEARERRISRLPEEQRGEAWDAEIRDAQARYDRIKAEDSE
jgi:hypothetical protein